MQFSAIVNRFIVKTNLNSTFTNDFKRKLKKNRKMFIVADLFSLNPLCHNSCNTNIWSTVVQCAKRRTRRIEDVRSNLTRSILFFPRKTGFYGLNTLDKRENA